MENPQQAAHTNTHAIPQRNRFDFAEPNQPSIFFTSCFDSGNMHKVIRNAHDHYSIWTACDAQGTTNEGYPKSWFYFEVGGFSNRRVAFSVHRVHFLCSLTKKHNLYRPVYRVTNDAGEKGQWLRLDHPIISLGVIEGQMTLKFDYLFTQTNCSVEFAFIYPYSYETCREDLRKLREEYQNDKELYFQQFELTKSYEGRSIDCLVISSHEGREGFECLKSPLDSKKIARFRANKPVIFVSARVHPIETPSSFCMKGIIEFLLNKQDMRAHLLRRYFVFVLVPMLNPDGVSRGHCRMDILNQNLNRYYTNPDPVTQPSCFAVKQLWQHYAQDQRLFMYVDLHAHPALKGNFAFGNAIYEFVEQVESQVFPRILAGNCVNFQFEQCIFSRKHMKAKDRNEEQTKEGCGRVVLYKEFGIVHSYTIECGYHLNSFNNAINPPSNTKSRFMVRYRTNDRGEKIYDPTEKIISEERYNRMKEESRDLKGWEIFQFLPHSLDDPSNEYYQRELPTYSIQTFFNLGRNVVISLLDVWGRNPYSRMQDLNVQRREIAEKQAKLDRFRKEQAGIKTKQRRIVELIEEQFYGEWHRRNVLNPQNYSQQRDKRRHNTLETQKPNIIRPNRSEKNENVKIESVKEDHGGKSQHGRNCETIEPDLLEHNPTTTTTIKIGLKDNKQSAEKITEGRGVGKNFKLSRINFAASLTHDKPTTRPIRDFIGTQLKLSTENELPQSNNDALSVHSKAMRIPNCNLRVRNVAALAIVRSIDDPRGKTLL